ncbi:MAG: hypothetical protein GKR89_25045 [Candidatus Latescibacteria bacterium]|nr:hypothetical protein [Candidatus Latescibacterota bacterium]
MREIVQMVASLSSMSLVLVAAIGLLAWMVYNQPKPKNRGRYAAEKSFEDE